MLLSHDIDGAEITLKKGLPLSAFSWISKLGEYAEAAFLGYREVRYGYF